MSSQSAEKSPATEAAGPDFRAVMRIAKELGGFVLGCMGLALLLLWAGENGFKISLLVLFITYALLALGMYVPFVLGGSMSLAYGAYAAIGAYAVAIPVSKFDLPLWVGWFVGPPISAAIAVVLGLATARLSSFYLAAVTLLFADAFSAWLGEAKSITGGSAGVGGLPLFAVGDWVPAPRTFVLGGLVLVALVTLAISRLRVSRWGLVVRAIHEVPLAVEVSGVSVPRMRLVMLMLGGAIASLSGAVFTSYNGSIFPNTFGLGVVFLAVFMPLIGGRTTPWGAVLGAAVVTWLTLYLEVLGDRGTLTVSLGVLVVILLLPKGLLGSIPALVGQGQRLIGRGGSHG